MIREILRFANRLDKKLDTTFGRPYRAILSAGLVISIINQSHQLMDAAKSGAGILGSATTILFGVVLLINQMGELSIRIDQRRAERSRRTPLTPR